MIRSLRSTTRRQRQGHKFCIFNDKNKNFAGPSRSFVFISVQFFPVLGKSAKWDDYFWSFTENVNTQPLTWIFSPSFDTAPLNSVPEFSLQLSKVKQTDMMTKKIENLKLTFRSATASIFNTQSTLLIINFISYHRNSTKSVSTILAVCYREQTTTRSGTPLY